MSKDLHIDETEAIYEFSFINHPQDDFEHNDESSESPFDCSRTFELTDGFINRIENSAIELIDLAE